MECFPGLSQFSEAGGCACKLDSSSLERILQLLGSPQVKDLLVDHTTADDCAVYRQSEEEYLLFTTDFFTPIIDDPRLFGSITASHALSDIYAMGGTPFLANAILGFPEKSIPASVIAEMIVAGQQTLQSHGCVIAGGHTITNPQLIYGFSIIGKVAKDHLKTNSGAREGDALILTKPIGSGILASALKLGLLCKENYQSLAGHLLEVNSIGKEIGKLPYVHAMTDVTGFGLLGHANEMARNASLQLTIHADSVNFLPGALEMAEAVISPESGIMKNLKNLRECVRFEEGITSLQRAVLCDPQTNGGLLIAVSPEYVDTVTVFLEEVLGRPCPKIGQFAVLERKEPHVVVR